MDEKYDVIVVGAGPAGGSSALHCAKAGLKTLIIEEHEIIGEPVHCGECLSEYAVQNTGIKPPESVISEHVKGVRVLFPGPEEAILNEPGFVLEKHKFEQWISKEAENQGAEIRLGCRLEDLERSNGTWKIKTTKGELESKILIDASGVASVVSRKLELNKRFEAVIGIQYELEDIPRDGYLDFYLWPEFAPHGYLWMIPKSNGRANVGLVTNEKNRARELNEKFVEKMGWKEKKKVKTFGGLIPASGPLDKTFSEGLMLVGDAAGFTSPLFEGGTHLSLKSGQFAAKVAAGAFEKKDFSAEVFSEYQKLWKAEFPDYGKIVKGKNALYGFTDKELEFIGKTLPPTFDNFNTMEKALFGLKIFMKEPGFYSREFIPAMLSLGYSKGEFYGW